MSYINVSSWSCEQVKGWMMGLSDSTIGTGAAGVDGCRLLQLTASELSQLSVYKIGHQEIIMQAVSQLQRLHFMLNAENLQQLIMRLMLKSISLNRQLERRHVERAKYCDRAQSSSHPPGSDLPPGNAPVCQQHVSISMLQLVTDLISSVKDLISWLNVAPFEGQQSFSRLRSLILEPSVQLAVNAQRDSFAVKPVDQIRHAASQLAHVCQSVLQDSADSLVLIPASFLVVSLKPKCGELLGLHLVRDLSGMATIAGLKFQSPAHMCGKLEQGDQLVQVNRQTVVGWQLDKIVNLLQAQRVCVEVYLTVKKRPKHNSIHDQASFRTFRRHKRHVHTNWNSRSGALSLLSKISIPLKTTDTDEADAETDSNDNDDEENPQPPILPEVDPSPADAVAPRPALLRRATISVTSLSRVLASSEQNLCNSQSGDNQIDEIPSCSSTTKYQRIGKRGSAPFFSGCFSDELDSGDFVRCRDTGETVSKFSMQVCGGVREVTECMAISTNCSDEPGAPTLSNCSNAAAPISSRGQWARSPTLLEASDWRSTSEPELLVPDLSEGFSQPSESPPGNT